MSKRAHGNDEIWEAEMMLAYHMRKAAKARRRLSTLRREEEYDTFLRRLAAYKQLTLRDDDERLVSRLRHDFRRQNPGLLLVEQPANYVKADPAPLEEQNDSDVLVMRGPGMITLRVLGAEKSQRHWLGPYDVLVPREQRNVMGEYGEGSYWGSSGDRNCTHEAYDNDVLCEDAWKELYAEYSPADNLWYCKKTAYL